MIIVALLGIKIINLFSMISVVLILISFVIIYIFSPVEDYNKLISEKEKTIYRKKVRKILIIEMVVLLIIIKGLEQYEIASTIVIAQMFVGVMVGIWKRK